MKMYFLAVVLPEDLNTKILGLKKWMHEKWGCKVGLKSPAHITLIPPFWMDENLEAPLINHITELSSRFTPFEVATNNFSCFKPRTIFIKPGFTEPLNNLKTQTDLFFKTHTQYAAKIDTRPFHPHITIATRDLRKSAFAEAWPHFESQPFQHTFLADAISLLCHNGHTWDVIHRAGFTKHAT